MKKGRYPLGHRPFFAVRQTHLRTRTTPRLRFRRDLRWALDPHRGRPAHGQHIPATVAGDQVS